MLVKGLKGGVASRRVVTRSNVTTTVAKAAKGTTTKGSRGVSIPLFNPNEKDFKQKKDALSEQPKLLTRYAPHPRWRARSLARERGAAATPSLPTPAVTTQPSE